MHHTLRVSWVFLRAICSPSYDALWLLFISTETLRLTFWLACAIVTCRRKRHPTVVVGLQQ